MKRSGQRSTYPLLESIGVWNGVMPYLSYHQKRVDRTFEKLFPESKSHSLQEILSGYTFPHGRVKLRFLYGSDDFAIEDKPYQRAHIYSIQIIEDSEIAYSLKYTDRERLNELYKKRGDHDDILIFKNGLLTDASYSNVICIMKDQLLTPASPLLNGVMRAYLLDQGILKTANINHDDLKKARGVILVNALNPLQTAPFIPIEQIHF